MDVQDETRKPKNMRSRLLLAAHSKYEAKSCAVVSGYEGAKEKKELTKEHVDGKQLIKGLLNACRAVGFTERGTRNKCQEAA